MFLLAGCLEDEFVGVRGCDLVGRDFLGFVAAGAGFVVVVDGAVVALGECAVGFEGLFDEFVVLVGGFGGVDADGDEGVVEFDFGAAGRAIRVFFV